MTAELPKGRIAIKLILSILAAWLLAASIHFLVLFALDHFFGSRQLAAELQAGRLGSVLRGMATMLWQSAAVTLPVIAVWGVVIVAIVRSRHFPRTLLATLAGASLLEALLVLLHFSPVETLPFLAGFIAAMFFLRLLWCKRK